MALLAALVCAPLLAAEPPPAEIFFGRAAMEQAVLSPDGKHLAFTAQAPGHDRLGLFVLPLDGSDKLRTLAAFRDIDVHGVSWVNDSLLVFSALDRSSGVGGDKSVGTGLYSVDLRGGGTQVVISRAVGDTEGRTRRTLSAGHSLLTIPDQKSPETADEVVVGRWSANDMVLLRLNIRTGETQPIRIGAPKGVMNWLFDSKGEARLAVTKSEGRQAMHWRAPGQTEWKQIAEYPLMKAPFAPHSVDDAGRLWVTVSKGARGDAALAEFDFAAGKPAEVATAHTPGFDFTGGFVRGAGGPAPLGLRVVTDAETTVWMDPTMKKIQAELDTRLPDRINSLSCARCGSEEAVVLVRSYSDRDPGQLWLYRAASKDLRPLGRVRPQVEPGQMATTDFQRIQARDGRDLPVWITRPATAETKAALPAVVMVHGGPWVRGGQWQWEPMRQFLASRGYMVIEPEFRGSTGYGQAHFRASFKQWGQAMQDDVADALLWAQKQGLASDKACIAGASYGGYATLMGLVRHPELYRCGVAWVGVADLMLLGKGSRPVRDDTSHESRSHTLPEMIGDPEKDRDMILANSPVEQAARIKAPLLLAYGAEDVRVPLAHGERMREALRKAGNEPEWVVYPDEAHSWRRSETRIDFARRVEVFLERHLTR
ncbi:MAG: prolyl oligopeptidase family serine peptidase [Inhella sp.]